MKLIFFRRLLGPSSLTLLVPWIRVSVLGSLMIFVASEGSAEFSLCLRVSHPSVSSDDD